LPNYLVGFSYIYFTVAILVLLNKIYYSLWGNYSFIADIRTINNVFNAILLLSWDFKLNEKLMNGLDKLILKVFTSKKDFLEDVSPEEISEVDLILSTFSDLDPSPAISHLRSEFISEEGLILMNNANPAPPLAPLIAPSQ
jgi:hypothetical protein